MSGPGHEPGVGVSPISFARDLAALAAATLTTRGELAALELTDARRHLRRWLAFIVIAAMLGLAALLTGAVLVAIVYWDTYRWQAILVLMALYALGGAVFAAAAAAESRAAPPLFEQTLRELKRDCDALRGSPSSPP